MINYEKIIIKYKNWRSKHKDSWIEHTKNQKTLERAILVAALARDENGNKNNHQRRLQNESLKNFGDELIKYEKEIHQTKQFDCLLKIIEKVSTNIKGVGKLAAYDTAVRIGSKLNLTPEFVYLHAGTKIGAEHILGKLRKSKIKIEELPDIFIAHKLTNIEVEEILCIYKKKFKTLKY